MLEDLYSFLNLDEVPHILGVPRFLYRQALEQGWKWVKTCVGRDPLERRVEGLYTIRFLGLIWERWCQYFGSRSAAAREASRSAGRAEAAVTRR
jgi:hypothetical protein